MVHKFKSINGAHTIILDHVFKLEWTILYPIFKPTPLATYKSNIKWSRGLDIMRYLDKIDCMRSKIDAIDIITNNLPHEMSESE